MRSEVLRGSRGPYLDLSPLFPDGMFAYLTLRGFSGALDAAGLSGFLEEMGHGSVDVATVRQVHSGSVVEESESPCEADGVVVRRPGSAARVVSADCVPVLLARKDGSACAGVHAGWKGTLAGISATAARLLGEGGRHPLVAYVGPAIGPCCYAVPPERVEAFRKAFPKWKITTGDDGDRLDLPGLNRASLIGEGLRGDDIHAEECCTACSPELCWSYRRDGASAGRMAALIGGPLTAPAPGSQA